jgi:hypothetical protein
VTQEALCPKCRSLNSVLSLARVCEGIGMASSNSRQKLYVIQSIYLEYLRRNASASCRRSDAISIYVAENLHRVHINYDVGGFTRGMKAPPITQKITLEAYVHHSKNTIISIGYAHFQVRSLRLSLASEAQRPTTSAKRSHASLWLKLHKLSQ